MNRGSLRKLMRRKSTTAFLMTVPLLAMIAVLVAYPAGFAIVSMLTSGGPLGATQVLATSAFFIGIMGGNLPKSEE